MLNQGARALSILFALSIVAVACGDDDDGDPTQTGGVGGKTTGGANSGGNAGRGGSGGTGGRGGATNGGANTGGTTGGTTGGVNTGGSSGGAVTGGTSGEGGSSGGGTEGGSSGSGTGGNGPEGGSSGAGAGGVGEGGGGGSEGGIGGSITGGAGGGDLGGAGAGGGGVVADTLDNPGFEDNWTGAPWAVTGTGWKISESGSGGPRFLDLWAAGAYTTALSQVVSPLPDGNYTFTISYYGGTHTADSQVAYVKGYDHTNPTATTTASTPAAGNGAYATITVGPFAVTSASGTSGSVEVGVTTDAAAGEWSHFDDAAVTKVP